jgi:hypothetical protein
VQVNIPDAALKPFKALIPALLGALLVLVALGRVPAPLPHAPVPDPAPAPAPRPDPTPKPEWFGWRPDDPGRPAVVASLPRLAKVAPHLLDARDQSDGRPILLYKAWTELFNNDPPYVKQAIGDCVSFGHGHANDLLQCIEFCLAHPGKIPTPADIAETDTEFLYGAAREASGMLGVSDGSYGAAAVKAMTTVGLVSRRMMGSEGIYSGARAKRFGLVGPPADWKAKAAPFKLGSAAQVTTWDELVAALAAGHPVTICTRLGFTLARDAQGFCKRQGRWGHCMFIAGARFDREGACILQSWGPATPSGPRALDQPSYSFWADRADVEAILAEGDSWALSKAPHFGAPSGTPHKRRSLPAAWRRAA